MQRHVSSHVRSTFGGLQRQLIRIAGDQASRAARALPRALSRIPAALIDGLVAAAFSRNVAPRSPAFSVPPAAAPDVAPDLAPAERKAT